MVTWNETYTTICDLNREEFVSPLNLRLVDTDPRKSCVINRIEFLKNCSDNHLWVNNIPY